MAYSTSRELLEELAWAIRKHRIFMVYQPQIRADDGSVGGVEALVRWKRRDGVMVPPDIFVPLAESNGLINELTACVISRVLEDYRVIHANGIPVPMSINVSARDLREGDFIPAFLHAADHLLLEPSHFSFEITETAIVEDYASCIKNVSLLKSLGCRISLDDFGTGNASCKYVRSFPMDEIKVDRYFIKEIVNNEIDRVIVAFMVDLAHRLGCVAVAEGVEDEATAEVLRGAGCDLLQGYRFSKPLNVYDLVEYVNARNYKVGN
jgi:EAL domain-containing protein (putative c-di-GMP-specific phosphodiesterase class I)